MPGRLPKQHLPPSLETVLNLLTSSFMISPSFLTDSFMLLLSQLTLSLSAVKYVSPASHLD